ncbi:MAG: PTS sugar transporter subunit IIB [Deltaproteobacteria bacterium]|nr:PTS sugar transporter subunit IIB [Deltaproteobacteria bacterium]
MPIILARVDERLIHGQIMSSPALAALRVNRIIVADGKLSQSFEMQDVYNSTLQSGDYPILGADYVPPVELADFLKRRDGRDQRFLAIFRGPDSALEAVREGTPLPSLNLGNFTSREPGRRSLTAAFSVGPRESLVLNELHGLVGTLYFNGLGSKNRPYSPEKHSWIPE